MVIHIGFTQKWAAGYNLPLRSGKRTMMGGFINGYMLWVIYFLGIALLVYFQIECTA